MRRKVLQFTDLVVPRKEVQWDSRHGFYVEGFRWTPDNEGCAVEAFCHNFSASYSEHCLCWFPPRALFIVSKAMAQEAAHVFYSCNRIIVVDRDDNDDTNNYDLLTGLVDAAMFIRKRSIHPEMLGHIRTLEIVLPTAQDSADVWESQAGQALRGWQMAIDNLKRHANLPALTLVVLIDVWYCQWDVEHVEYFLQNADDLYLAALPILEPFRQMRDLKRFFVRLEWSSHWSPGYLIPEDVAEDMTAVRLCRNWGRRLERIERTLEKFVKGDDYDSRALGKLGCGPSLWMIELWDYFTMKQRK